MRHISIEQAQGEVVPGGPATDPCLQQLLEQLHELSMKVSSALRPQEQDALDESSRLRLVAEILEFRKRRNRAFGGDLFGEPAWDMLLELYAAERTGRRLSVSGACYASGVPLTTALRWIARLEKEGWIIRIDDLFDGRRSWLTLSEAGETKMGALLNRMAVGRQ